MLKSLLFLSAILLLLPACGKDEVRPTTGWAETTVPTTEELTALDFYDSSFGVVSATVGTLLKTEDGGDSWQALDPGTTNSLLAVFVLNRDTFFTSRNGLYGTTDGGRTFRELGDFAATDNSVFAIHFFSAKVGIVTQSGNIYRTTDGGDTWTLTYPYNGFASLLAATTNHTVYFAGGRTYDAVHEGELHKSTDNGDTWQQVNLPAEIAQSEITAIAFPTDQTGYLATFDQRVYRTTDAAATWQAVTSPDGGYVPSIHFENPTKGYLISGTRIYSTTNGGTIWSPEHASREDLFALDESPDHTLFAIGRNATFLKQR